MSHTPCFKVIAWTEAGGSNHSPLVGCTHLNARGWERVRYDTKEFLSSSVWRKKRERILKRDNYECQLSKRYGKHIPAEIVHHIFPRDEYPQYALADWNLIALSITQHRKLHTDNNGLTKDGWDLLRKTARANHIELKED